MISLDKNHYLVGDKRKQVAFNIESRAWKSKKKKKKKKKSDLKCCGDLEAEKKSGNKAKHEGNDVR